MSPRSLLTLILLLCVALLPYAPASAPVCSDAVITMSPDYNFVIGSAFFSSPSSAPESGSLYRWKVNGLPLSAASQVAEELLLNFDFSTQGVNGEVPLQQEGVDYLPGKWGQALSLADAGKLRFPFQNVLALPEGTIEMWVALRSAGSDPIYADRDHYLFYYEAANDDTLYITLSPNTGILYGGGEVDNEWQSAYGFQASTRSWKAGEWRHIALTYSAAGNFIRFYVDGVLAADTNEGHYWAPDATGADVYIGSARWGDPAYVWIDALRISGYASDSAEIAARAQRLSPPLPNEVWRPTNQVPPGSALEYEFTPLAAGEAGSPCTSPVHVYPGIPITNPQPVSTLLPPGATSLTLTVQSIQDTACAYALGQPLPYSSMTPFVHGSGTQTHTTIISGLDADPASLNHVYVRCASHPDYVLPLLYRSRTAVNPSYPRTGNLWGWWNFLDKSLEYIARTDLWLGADFLPDQVRQLRQLNPNILILTSINAVENDGLPDDYYLRDVEGKRIEVWPDSFRLNLTRPYVAEYQARYAYQRMLEGQMMYDGVFFDNVMTTQSWLTEDIYGHTIKIDADEDGLPDAPEALDAAWKAGVFHEIQTFRQLMPNAIVNGHSMDITEPGIGELFNGISLGFDTAHVVEGKMTFFELWERYALWMTDALSPHISMFEASPPDQIAYGYGYEPLENIPPSTLEFARTLYPYMRFGLALSLMNDGYFAYEFGDTYHGNDWWYDELDFDLGYPLGEAEKISFSDFNPGSNQIINPSFENSLDGWDFGVDSGSGYEATLARDTSTAAQGGASARIDVTASPGTEWRVALSQPDHTLQQDQRYDLIFWARSDAPRSIAVNAQKDSPDWDGYGLYQRVQIGTTWQEYTVSFEATANATNAMYQFFFGETTGTVWLDDVRLTLHPPDVFQRQYTQGMVLLNGSHTTQMVSLDPRQYRRLIGNQAPLFEGLLDDQSSSFVSCENCQSASYDSGKWKAYGPYYHDWGSGVHRITPSGSARWDLPLTATDVYTVSVWWPASPKASSWNSNVLVQIYAGGEVRSSATFDQRSGGDQWHALPAVRLSPSEKAFALMTCSGSAPCIADALYWRSRQRYNDGSLAGRILIPPLDGIVLQRIAAQIYLPIVRR